MPTNYDKWIFSAGKFPSGNYSIVILRHRTDFFLDAETGSYIIVDDDISRRFILGFDPIKKTLDLQEGGMKAPSTQIQIHDLPGYSGLVDGSTPFSESLEHGLFSHIFDSETGNYRIYIIREKDSESECILIGRVHNADVARTHVLLHKGQSDDERNSQTVTLPVNSLAEIMKEKTAGDLIDTIVEADCIGNYPFYAGITPMPMDIQRDFALLDTDGTTLTGFAVDHKTRNANPGQYVQLASHGIHDAADEAELSGAFPAGKWGITVVKILERIAEVCGLLTFNVTDFISPMKPYYNSYNESTDHAYSYLDFNPTSVSVYLNYAFGISPIDGSEFSSPVSFKWDDTLAAVAASFATDFGCYIWPIIDSDEMNIGFQIIRRDFDWSLIAGKSGTIPEQWKRGFIKESREETRPNTFSAVVVKNAGSDSGVRVYTGHKGDDLEITVRFRGRAFGTIYSEAASTVAPTYGYQHYTFNTKWKTGEQAQVNTRYDRSKQDAPLADAGWIIGSHYFYYHNSSARLAYSQQMYESSILQNDDGEGFYAVAGFAEKTLATSETRQTRTNTLLGLGQLIAREYIGTQIHLVRKYPGVLHDNGKYNDIHPGLTDTWMYNGQLRQFKIVETTQLHKENETEVRWCEYVNHESAADLPYKYFSGDENTGGVSTGSGTSGGNGGSGGDNVTIITTSLKLPFSGSATTYQGVGPPVFHIVQLGDHTAISASNVATSGDDTTCAIASFAIGGYGYSATRNSGENVPIGANVLIRNISSFDDKPCLETRHNGSTGVSVLHKINEPFNPDDVAEFFTNGTGASIFVNGALKLRKVVVSGAYNIGLRDCVVSSINPAVPFVGGDTWTLPAAGSFGARLLICKDAIGGSKGANGTIFILPSGADTVDGFGGGTTIPTTFGSVWLMSNGVSNWEIIQRQ